MNRVEMPSQAWQVLFAMLAVQSEPVTAQSRPAEPLPLENGDGLHAQEFLRRYEAMPHIKKAELIAGKVYMGSPVRADLHAEPDGLIHLWLATYAAHTPGTKFYPNATLLLDADNTFQPDAMLCLTPERGGRTKLDAKGYLCGPPELVVEIAASSASIDLQDKYQVYRRSGVPEYLVWRTAERRFDWFCLGEDEYQSQTPDTQNLLRSRTFPGLVLALAPLLCLDAAAVLAALPPGATTRP
jgi:Uma2 family endonuclease